jgi:hypothetical protein
MYSVSPLFDTMNDILAPCTTGHYEVHISSESDPCISELADCTSDDPSYDNNQNLHSKYFQSCTSERQVYGSGLGWTHGSYGSADYEYGQSGFGQSHAQLVNPNSRLVSGSNPNCRNIPRYRTDCVRSRVAGTNRMLATHGHSHDTSKQLEFSAKGRYYYYE